MQVLPLHGYCVALIIMIVIWCSTVLDKASWTPIWCSVGLLWETFLNFLTTIWNPSV